MAIGGGTVFQLFPSCERILTTVNPCGTIFGFCSPSDLDALFTTIPDYDYDPTCTVPGYGWNVVGDNPNGCAGGLIYPTTNGERPR